VEILDAFGEQEHAVATFSGNVQDSKPALECDTGLEDAPRVSPGMAYEDQHIGTPYVFEVTLGDFLVRSARVLNPAGRACMARLFKLGRVFPASTPVA
jgi:hypothetical protein